MKRDVLRALNELPDDATIEDAMERLYLFLKVERGTRQADAGQKVTQAEAKARMSGGFRKLDRSSPGGSRGGLSLHRA